LPPRVLDVDGVRVLVHYGAALGTVPVIVTISPEGALDDRHRREVEDWVRSDWTPGLTFAFTYVA
jgi:hypothetical protein